MNPREKQKYKHDKQVFNQEYSEFVVYLEKTIAGEMTVSAAIATLKMEKNEWYRLKKLYSEFNGLNK